MLETTTRVYKPSGQGVACDAYVQNPRWGEPGQVKLIRCRQYYTHRVTYRDGKEVTTALRCNDHAAELWALDKAGRVEILFDEDDTFYQARSQSAVWVTFQPRAFYRPGRDGLEVATVDAGGNLGPWELWGWSYPPKNAIRL